LLPQLDIDKQINGEFYAANCVTSLPPLGYSAITRKRRQARAIHSSAAQNRTHRHDPHEIRRDVVEWLLI
jgi:hypothetical protein